MKRGYALLMMSVCAVFTASVASAQDKPHCGLVMGFPATFAIRWHASDKVAIQPEVQVTRVSGSFASGATSSSNTGLLTTVGASAMFYGAAKDNVRIYFSPRVVYTHTSSTAKSTSALGTVVTSTSTGDGYGWSGSAGAEYSLSRRFAAYAELGFGHNHTSGGGSKSDQFGIRSAVGGILYF